MHWILILCGYILLVSCTSQPIQTTPVPTPQVVSVMIDPAAEKVVDAFNACAKSLPEQAVFISIQPLNANYLNTSNLIIKWNKTDLDGHEAYPIASDKLAIVVNSVNPISSLTRDQLLDIYQQQQETWTDSSGKRRDISLWAYQESDPAQVVFESMLSEIPLKLGSVNIAPDPKAMIDAITSDPNALGFIPRSWLVNGLKEVTIKPALLDSYPILALTPDHINDSTRLLVACLQGPTGLTALMKYYDK